MAGEPVLAPVGGRLRGSWQGACFRAAAATTAAAGFAGETVVGAGAFEDDGAKGREAGADDGDVDFHCCPGYVVDGFL